MDAMSHGAAPAPRVLIVEPGQWPRALLRAALRESGYDAIGARGLLEAFTQAPDAPGRGPVRALVIDEDALVEDHFQRVERLRDHFGGPTMLLVAHAGHPAPPGPWTRVLRRPIALEEIAAAVRALLPLPPGAALPLDA